jgi:hypothetical protein
VEKVTATRLQTRETCQSKSCLTKTTNCSLIENRRAMMGKLALEGVDHYGNAWGTLFQFLAEKFDIADVDRRCFVIAKNQNLLTG